MNRDLTKKNCAPCEGNVPPLAGAELDGYLEEVPGWNVDETGTAISKQFEFSDFTDCLDFVNRLGELAESEGHHPDISIHDYNKVTVTLKTHAIQGLSENDFILAAKANLLL